jgi:hypothetical protein
VDLLLAAPARLETRLAREDRYTCDDRLIGPQCDRTKTVQRPEQLEHDPEKLVRVFGKDYAQTTS